MKQSTLNVLLNDITVTGKIVTINKQLSPDTFQAVKQVFTAYRGKWRGGNTQAFIFPIEPTEFFAHVIKTKEMPKANLHSYHPTPQSARDLIFNHTPADPDYWSGLKRPVQILEPCAGQGHLLDEICQRFTQAGVAFEITSIELDPLNCLTLKQKGYRHIETDFLKYKTDKQFDLVVMNPPFNGLAFGQFIRHAQKMLHGEGRLVSVVPTLPLQIRDAPGIHSLRDEACLLEGDPLMLPKGTFSTAPSIECRIIVLGDEHEMATSLKNKNILEHHTQNIILSCWHTGECNQALRRLTGNALSEKSVEQIIRPFFAGLRRNNVLINKDTLGTSVRQLIENVKEAQKNYHSTDVAA